MLYHAYEFTHAAMGPARTVARISKEVIGNPFNPTASWYGTRATTAAIDMFIDATRRYGKPEWNLKPLTIDGQDVKVSPTIATSLPFCNLIHFKRSGKAVKDRNDPKVLIIAPMSGHYATLLRGTVQEMIKEHEVYITDWTDAREVPVTSGTFDLDDYTDYLIKFCQFLGKDGVRPAVMAVCQPGVPMLVAASLMAEDNDPARPASVTLMGSPIDTARSPKKPNELATSRPLSWFRNNVITTVPWPNVGCMRQVYPGFLQLSGFMSMNIDRHVDAHARQFGNLIRGDGDSTDAHRSFYDEYLAVMDLSAEFYLQTIERVFQKRLLAVGEYQYRERLVDPGAVKDIAFFTVEGEKDDITGLEQTEAAHGLLTALPKSRKKHFVAPGVGHYGVFNGKRWRSNIQPKVKRFIAKHHQQ